MRDLFFTILIKFGLWLISLIPPSLFLFFSRIVARGLFHFLARERSIIYYQLKFVFPELSDAELLELGKECFLSFSLLIVESVNSKKLVSRIAYPGDPSKEETGYFKYKDSCGVGEIHQKNTGAICLVSHSGNFELLAAFYVAKGIRLTSIAREPNYKALIKIVKDFRSSYGLDFLWREEVGNPIRLLKVIKSGRFLAALIDQDTTLDSIYAKFFGLECAFPKGPISIAIRMNKPVFVTFDRRLKDGSHQVHISRVHWEQYADTLSKQELEQFVVNEYSAQLEKHIKATPSQWVWWHRRWRRKEGENPEEPMSTEAYLEFLKQKIELRERNKDL